MKKYLDIYGIEYTLLLVYLDIFQQSSDHIESISEEFLMRKNISAREAHPQHKNKNIYCRLQGNTKLYKLKNYKPIYKYKYFSGMGYYHQAKRRKDGNKGGTGG